MAVEEDASPSHPLDPPLPSLITMFLTTTPTSRFGFSMMWGKFCQSFFEIRARTALAQFAHFTLKARVRFQMREGRPPKPPPVDAPLVHTWALFKILFKFSPT